MCHSENNSECRDKGEREVNSTTTQHPGVIETLFPASDRRTSREERLRRIKRIVKKEDFVTEEKLEKAIEKLIDFVIFS